MQLEEIEVAFKLPKDDLPVRLHLTSSLTCQPNFRYASVGRWKMRVDHLDGRKLSPAPPAS